MRKSRTAVHDRRPPELMSLRLPFRRRFVLVGDLVRLLIDHHSAAGVYSFDHSAAAVYPASTTREVPVIPDD